MGWVSVMIAAPIAAAIVVVILQRRDGRGSAAGDLHNDPTRIASRRNDEEVRP